MTPPCSVTLVLNFMSGAATTIGDGRGGEVAEGPNGGGQ